MRKKRRLEDNEGGSSEVRAESLEGNNLSELLNMSEYTLEASQEKKDVSWHIMRRKIVGNMTFWVTKYV